MARGGGKGAKGARRGAGLSRAGIRRPAKNGGRDGARSRQKPEAGGKGGRDSSRGGRGGRAWGSSSGSDVKVEAHKAGDRMRYEDTKAGQRAMRQETHEARSTVKRERTEASTYLKGNKRQRKIAREAARPLCRDFLAGTCERGDSCLFPHSKAQTCVAPVKAVPKGPPKGVRAHTLEELQGLAERNTAQQLHLDYLLLLRWLQASFARDGDVVTRAVLACPPGQGIDGLRAVLEQHIVRHNGRKTKAKLKKGSKRREAQASAVLNARVLHKGAQMLHLMNTATAGLSALGAKWITLQHGDKDSKRKAKKARQRKRKLKERAAVERLALKIATGQLQVPTEESE